MKYLIFSVGILSIISILSPVSFANENLLTREEAFIFFAEQQKQIPESFQYINLRFTDVLPNTPLEDALQKLVYTNSIKNTASRILPSQTLSQYEFYSLASVILKLPNLSLSKEGFDIPATLGEKESLEKLLPETSSGKISIQLNTSGKNTVTLSKKEKIFFDVYETLQEDHYDAESFTEDLLIEGAIKGLTQETGDKYTTYFPPVESSDFFKALEGEYEGIGAYVEMPAPGKLIIISPIVGSPAEASGLKGGDIITHIDGKEITQSNILGEVVSWIKGPAGSTVELTIKRDGASESLIISVTRAKIVIQDIEYKKLDTSTFYIQIKSFGEKSDTEFVQALTELKAQTRIEKLIIDVRNNPGGYLDEVSDILSYFIPAGKPTAIVSTANKDTSYLSHGYTLIDGQSYKIILLQNGGSASASEILTGTLKDYFPEIQIIGEQSFGKGSVQSLKNYYDGSTLKYTSAKWFTGKTRQGIDGVGIQPDMILEFDSELHTQTKIDNQLQAALDY